jgi:hypothetical protein
MSGPKSIALMIIGLLALMVPAYVDAQGVAFAVFNGAYPDAELHRLNLQTGELTPVGSIGSPVTHIAFDSNGSLYGVDPDNDQLLSIDVMTGSGTPVGPLGATIEWVQGLTFSSDDRLWMAASDAILGPSLYEVDRITGAATWRFAVDGAHFGALAADDDTLFMASSSLAVVDTSTGSVSPLPGSDFEIWWARALDFDADGTLWGLMLCGPCMGPFDVLIMQTIDPTTGNFASTGPWEPHGTWGFAILDGALLLDGFESGDTSAWSTTLP